MSKKARSSSPPDLSRLLDFPMDRQLKDALSSAATLKRHKAGDSVFHFSLHRQDVHVVASGVLMRRQLHSSGSEGFLTRFHGAKNILGLESLFTPGIQGHLKVVDTAVTDAETWAIPVAEFDALVTRYPTFARGLIHYLSRENAIVTMLVIMRKRKDNPGFLARVLLQLLGLFRASLPKEDECLISNISRNHLAEYTGMSRQMVFGILGKLEKSGIIRREGRNLRIENLEALVRAATLEEPKRSRHPAPLAYQFSIPAWSAPLR
ncbi:MAG: Crp/Fnr family transcriptional regulator [Planctomycetota bacterium]